VIPPYADEPAAGTVLTVRDDVLACQPLSDGRGATRRMSSTSGRRSSGVPEASSSEALRRMQRARRRDTAAELALRSLLHRAGYRYRVDASPGAGVRRRADIVFRSEQVAVYVDGCFWHGCPVHRTWPKANATWWRAKLEANESRDRDTDESLRRAGWLPVRVWEHEEARAAALRVERAVLERRAVRLEGFEAAPSMAEKARGRVWARGDGGQVDLL
jgi:DNA mismatch endonuclease (patch repair protein)